MAPQPERDASKCPLEATANRAQAAQDVCNLAGSMFNTPKPVEYDNAWIL